MSPSSAELRDGEAAFEEGHEGWRLAYRVSDGHLRLRAVDGDRPGPAAVLRRVDALRSRHDVDRVHVAAAVADEIGLDERRWESHDDGLSLPLEAFLQLRRPWLDDRLLAVPPERRVEAEVPGGWHPRRPAVPDGHLFTKHLAATGQTFALHRATLDEHGELFHRWQNTPHVAEAWNEEGTREEHDAYLRERRADLHIEPLVGTVDGTPFAYVEVYWAREDRIGPHCGPGPYDQGLHLLVGEPDHLGGPLTAAWMRATFQFMFLREPRTRRLVGEPEASNDRVLARLRETGWRKRGEFDFPHKRAALVTLDRARFFQGEHP